MAYGLQAEGTPGLASQLSLDMGDSTFEDLSPCKPQRGGRNMLGCLGSAFSEASTLAHSTLSHSGLRILPHKADRTSSNHGDELGFSSGSHSAMDNQLSLDQLDTQTYRHAGRAATLPSTQGRNEEPEPVARSRAAFRTMSLQAAGGQSSPSRGTSRWRNPFGLHDEENDVPLGSDVLGQNQTASVESLVSTASSISPCTDLEFETEVETEVDMDTDPELDTDADDLDFGSNNSGQSPPRYGRHPTHPTDGAAAAAAGLPLPGSASQRESIYHRPNRSVLGISFRQTATQRRFGMISEEEGVSEASAISSRDSFRGSGRTWAPTSKVRRTQSMFATPEQFLHEQVGPLERPPAGQPDINCVSFLESPACPIPTFSVRQDPFPRVTHQTLVRLLDGEFSEIYTEIIVIDCRFEYEYEGGHIDGAININSKQQLEQVMFRQRSCEFGRPVLLVFHCEHSAYRSPVLASHMRHCDRDTNVASYPQLYYPDIVVLDGGYSRFYTEQTSRCVPRNYVGMNHQEHKQTCEREMSRFRNHMKPRKVSTFLSGGSTPNLHDFRFPQPAPGIRSASVTDFGSSTTNRTGSSIF